MSKGESDEEQLQQQTTPGGNRRRQQCERQVSVSTALAIVHESSSATSDSNNTSGSTSRESFDTWSSNDDEVSKPLTSRHRPSVVGSLETADDRSFVSGSSYGSTVYVDTSGSTQTAQEEDDYTTGSSYSCSTLDATESQSESLAPTERSNRSPESEYSGLGSWADDDPASEYVRLPRTPPLRLLFIRHAETMNDVFPNWTKRAFGANLDYRPYNLNQPLRLINRGLDTIARYEQDPPLTMYGNACAAMLGEAIGSHLNSGHSNRKVVGIYSSPALSCVDTACNIANEVGGDLRVRVDIGLEQWQIGDVKQRIAPSTLLANCDKPVDHRHWFLGAPVTDSTPQRRIAEQEDISSYYSRIANSIYGIRRCHPAGGVVVIVGDATTIDAGVRPLLRRPISLKETSAHRHIRLVDGHYPHMTTVLLEIDPASALWSIGRNPVPPFSTATYTSKIDGDFLMREEEPGSECPPSNVSSLLSTVG